jgi:hypothetical protein
LRGRRAAGFQQLTDFYLRRRGFDKIAQRFWTTRTRRSGAKRRIRGAAANNPTLSATSFPSHFRYLTQHRIFLLSTYCQILRTLGDESRSIARALRLHSQRKSEHEHRAIPRAQRSGDEGVYTHFTALPRRRGSILRRNHCQWQNFDKEFATRAIPLVSTSELSGVSPLLARRMPVRPPGIRATILPPQPIIRG